VSGTTRSADRLPPIVRALLDTRDEAVVIFGARGDVVYLNAPAQAALSPASLSPFLDGRRCRAELLARGGRLVPLKADGKALGEMIVVPRARAETLADQEREAIRQMLLQAGGRRLEAARRLGISRTTLWRRLRAGER